MRTRNNKTETTKTSLYNNLIFLNFTSAIVKKHKLRYAEVYSSPDSDTSECNKAPETDDLSKEFEVNNFVLVRLCGKRKIYHYIAQVLTINKDDYDLEVKYMRRHGEKFVFPEVEDIASISVDDVIIVLNKPIKCKRGAYKFVDNLSIYKDLL